MSKVDEIFEKARKICKPVTNTKLTEDLTLRVVATMMLGTSVRAACGHLGISDRTYRNWMKWGREGKAEEYVNFYNAVKRGEAAKACDMASTWNHACERDWKAAKAFLESRWPEEWGKRRKQKPERQLPQQTPIVINVTLTAGQNLMDAIPPNYLPHVQVIEPKALPEPEAGG